MTKRTYHSKAATTPPEFRDWLSVTMTFNWCSWLGKNCFLLFTTIYQALNNGMKCRSNMKAHLIQQPNNITFNYGKVTHLLIIYTIMLRLFQYYLYSKNFTKQLTNVVGVVRFLQYFWSFFNNMHEWVKVMYSILRKLGKKLMHHDSIYFI